MSLARPYKEKPTSMHMQGDIRIRKSDWKKFEAAWHRALKEFDPGPADKRLLVMTNTRTAGDQVSGLPYRLQNMVTLGLASYVPNNALILRESVETREAPDGELYRRTIRVCLRKDGFFEFGVRG